MNEGGDPVTVETPTAAGAGRRPPTLGRAAGRAEAVPTPSRPQRPCARRRCSELEDVQLPSTARSGRSATSTWTIPQNRITALIGPSGCGKTTLLRCFNRMNDLVPSAHMHAARSCTTAWTCIDPAVDRGRGPPAHRHGVPEAQPVPQVDLRQHRLRAQGRRLQGQHGRARRAEPPPRGDLGRGQGQAQAARHRAVGRPAAAPVHRPRDRRPAGRDPHGRALLGARSRSPRCGSRS